MDTIRTSAFFDELTKIAADPNKDRITKDKIKKLLRYGGAGALGSGVGYAAGEFIGKPLQRKALELGLKVGPAKALRYGVPTMAGLGAGLMLARTSMAQKLKEKIEKK
jgi:hypothetical protein